MNRERRTFWLRTSTALAAGLLLRLWFVFHLSLVDGDSLIYGGIARNFLLHGVYGFSSGHVPGSVAPTLIRLPGYPIFLAACFRLFGMEHYRAVMFVQIAADLATCWLASALAGRLFGRRSALVVLWLAALCPFTSSYVAVPLTETLVLTSIALAFYGFTRWQDRGLGFNRWLWVVAATVGYSILLRPEQGLLAVAILPAMLWTSISASKPRTRVVRAMLPIATAALCIVLPLLPWTLRNWHTFHVIEPLVPKYATDPGEISPAGFGRWYRTWSIEFISTEDIYWNYGGNPLELDTLPSRAYDGDSRSSPGPNDLRHRTSQLFQDYNATTTVTQNIDDRFGALASERIRANPVLYYAALPVARLLDMTLRPRTENMPVALDWWRWSRHPGQSAFAGAYAALNLTYIAVGLAGVYFWTRRGSVSFGRAPSQRALAFAMAASLILRSVLLLTLDNSEPRYTLEFFPVLFVWAGALFAAPAEPSVHG